MNRNPPIQNYSGVLRDHLGNRRGTVGQPLPIITLFELGKNSLSEYFARGSIRNETFQTIAHFDSGFVVVDRRQDEDAIVFTFFPDAPGFEKIHRRAVNVGPFD